MATTINGINDGKVNIDTLNNNGVIDDKSELNELAAYLNMDNVALFGIFENMNVGTSPITLQDLLEKIEDGAVPKTAEEAKVMLAKAEALKNTLAAIKTKMEELKTTIDAPATPPDQKAKAQKDLQELKNAEAQANKELKAILENINKSGKLPEDKKSSFNTLAKDSGLNFDSAAQKGATTPDSPLPTTPFSSGAGTGGGAAAKAAADGKATEDPYSAFGSGYKAGVGDGGSAMFYTGMGDDFINDSWDMINESQKRQKMLMLFFYYAKMAMSGDIGAMYQFMRFLAHVIGRDKALQNVWMGTKLLELQDASRAATKELLATEVNGDENGEWTKKLQEIKGEEGMIATSQKLITQMMEEFTQIVETLTNVQKSLLDVNGKVLSNLSQWR